MLSNSLASARRTARRCAAAEWHSWPVSGAGRPFPTPILFFCTRVPPPVRFFTSYFYVPPSVSYR